MEEMNNLAEEVGSPVLTEQRQGEKQKVEEKDKRFDKVINCPFCKGHGEVYVRREWRKKEDSGHMHYSLVSSEVYQNYLNNPETRHQNEVWDSDLRESECPYCRGKGVAFARHFKSEARSEKCSKCSGTGKLVVRVKQDIGIGEEQHDCDMCEGAGKIDIPEKEWVHIKTIARLKEEGDQYDGWYDDSPIIFKEEINDENRNFFSKSKPRFQ